MYALNPLKLRIYYNKVHQMFTQCSHIISDELFDVGIAIAYSTPFWNDKATN